MRGVTAAKFLFNVDTYFTSVYPNSHAITIRPASVKEFYFILCSPEVSTFSRKGMLTLTR